MQHYWYRGKDMSATTNRIIFSVLQQETVNPKLSFCQILHSTEKDDNKIGV